MSLNFHGGGSAELKNNTLYIKGTNKADNINIIHDKDKIKVKINNNEEIFPAGNIEKIEISSLEGDDIIEFDDIRKGSGLKYLPLNIDGGDGNDFIATAAGDDIIFGGKGDDEIYAEGGKNIIYGGEGDDFIMGDLENKHKTKLIGGPGFDQTNKGFFRGNITIRK